MPTFRIPVRWMMYDALLIEADNIDEAINEARVADLGNGEYIDGSFEVDSDMIGYDNELDKYPKCEWNNHTSCPSYKKDKMDRGVYNTRPEDREKIICSFYDKEEKYCFNKDCKMHSGQNQIASVVDQVFHKTGE